MDPCGVGIVLFLPGDAPACPVCAEACCLVWFAVAAAPAELDALPPSGLLPSDSAFAWWSAVTEVNMAIPACS